MVKQSEMTDEKWEEMKKVVKEYTCAECGAELTIHTNPEKGTIEVGCLNREHHGWVQRETYTQALRRGEDIHPAIKSAIEKKMLPKDQLGRAMNLLALRYPDAIVDPGTAALFIMDCARLDLDPLIQPAEAVPVAFKRYQRDEQGKKQQVGFTVSMIITLDGWLSMAARGCAEKWVGSPSIEPVYDERLAESLCGDPKAWLYKAVGRTKDMAPGETSSTYGWFKQKEYKDALERSTPAAKQPGNQAAVRAIKKWVRQNFPDCRQKMIEMTSEWVRRAEGIKEAQEYIDAEYSIIISTEGEETRASRAGGEEQSKAQQSGVERSEARASETKVETQKSPSAPAAAPQLPKNPVFKTWGELAQAAAKLGVNPSDVFKMAGVKRWEDFKDYRDAWNWVEEIVTERATKPKML